MTRRRASAITTATPSTPIRRRRARSTRAVRRSDRRARSPATQAQRARRVSSARFADGAILDVGTGTGRAALLLARARRHRHRRRCVRARCWRSPAAARRRRSRGHVSCRATPTRSSFPIAAFDVARQPARADAHAATGGSARRAVPRRRAAGDRRLSVGAQRRARCSRWRAAVAHAARRADRGVSRVLRSRRSRDALAQPRLPRPLGAPAVRPADRAFTRRSDRRRFTTARRGVARPRSGCCGSFGSPVTLVAERCASS